MTVKRLDAPGAGDGIWEVPSPMERTMDDLTQGGRKVRSLATRYKGILFRSASEAKWAQAMDELGIEWEYEPEALMLPGGLTYLPDFRLLIPGQFAEVKAAGRVSAGESVKKILSMPGAWGSVLGGPRPRIQVVVLLSSGRAWGIGAPEGTTSASGMTIWPSPAVVRCLRCHLVFWSPFPCPFPGHYASKMDVNMAPVNGAHGCHLCGPGSEVELVRHLNRPFYRSEPEAPPS